MSLLVTFNYLQCSRIQLYMPNLTVDSTKKRSFENDFFASETPTGDGESQNYFNYFPNPNFLTVFEPDVYGHHEHRL